MLHFCGGPPYKISIVHPLAARGIQRVCSSDWDEDKLKHFDIRKHTTKAIPSTELTDSASTDSSSTTSLRSTYSWWSTYSHASESLPTFMQTNHKSTYTQAPALTEGKELESTTTAARSSTSWSSSRNYSTFVLFETIRTHPGSIKEQAEKK